MPILSATRRLVSVLVVFFVLFSCASFSAAAEPAKGQPSKAAASAVKLKQIHTYDLLDRLSSLNGKVILVNFFAAFCGPCRREIPELVRLRAEVSRDDLEIIGIAIDENIKDAEKFVKSMGINGAYPVFYGGEEIARAYRVDAIPFNVIYNRKGHIEVSEAGYVPPAEMRQFIMELIRR